MRIAIAHQCIALMRWRGGFNIAKPIFLPLLLC